MATSATTTKKAPSRIMDTDPKTGRRYVKTTTVDGATVTAVKFVGVLTGEKYSWSSATYDVTSPAGELFAASIKWDGKTFKVGNKPAPSLGRAVRAVLGTEALPEAKPKAAPKPRTSAEKMAAQAEAAKAAAEGGETPAEGDKPKGRTRKSAATRKAEKAAESGSSIIVKDPETGLPAIDPAVQAKADAIAAEQVAKNEQAAADAAVLAETAEGHGVDVTTITTPDEFVATVHDILGGKK